MIAASLSRCIIVYNEIYRSMKSPLTIPQVLVLMHLSEEKTVRDVFLEESTGLSRQTINDIVHRVKKRGFVIRTSSGNPKKTILTSGGAKALRLALRAIHKTDEEFLRGLAPVYRPEFITSLKTIATFGLSQSPSPDA